MEGKELIPLPKLKSSKKSIRKNSNKDERENWCLEGKWGGC